MRVGLAIHGAGGLSFDAWSAGVATAERLNFPSVFISDHFFVGKPRDSIEPYLLLALAARETSRIRLGTLVTPVTFREPWNLGRMAADIDLLSGGRFTLGLGAGWLEAEHTAFGIPFPPIGERLGRLGEYIEVMRAMWGPGPTSFEGKYYRLNGANALPKPAEGRPHLMIGGGGERGTLRLVAKYADEWNCGTMTPADLRHKREVLAEHCGKIGRDPATISTSMLNYALVGRTPEELEKATKLMRGALAPGSAGTLDEYREAQMKRGSLAGSAQQIVDQLGPFAEAGLDEVILPFAEPLSDEIPAFIAAEIAPKVAGI